MLKPQTATNLSSELSIITESYPYSIAEEDTFIESELQAALKKFSHVRLIPSRLEGSLASIDSRIALDTSLAEVLKRLKKNPIFRCGVFIRVIFTKLFWQELLRKPKYTLQPLAIYRLWRYLARAMVVAGWSRLESSRPPNNLNIFLTYWCNEITTGIALAQNKNSNIILCSRGHGVDVFTERHQPPILPCREITLKLLSGLYFTSQNALNYTDNHFPGHSRILHVAPLGVPPPKGMNVRSNDGTIHFASCSALVPVKRIDLLARGLALLASLHPATSFQWDHFGGGPLHSKVQELCHAIMPSNIQWNFHGALKNSAIMVFYLQQPIDYFVNMSSSEGGRPVAIMEAMSYGIPAIGPAQGGISEIISSKNGLLLAPNPTPANIAHDIASLLNLENHGDNLRTGARQTWELEYNADRTSENFIQQLLELDERIKQL